MKKRMNRFLFLSLSAIAVLCIGIFALMYEVNNKSSAKTITEVGTIYMSGMNEQISRHFKTTMDLYLDMVTYIIRSVPQGENGDPQEVKEGLSAAGKLRDFPLMALYSREGELEMIYGEEVALADPQPFLDSLNADERKIAVAHSASGNTYALIGISAVYPMEGGGECTALIAGLPIEIFEETLGLGYDDTLVYSNIIRRDGSYIIKSTESGPDNYFTRIREAFQELNGKDAEMYVAELSSAMEKGEDYSSVLLIGNERRHLYCSALPNSEWYLVTVMPYGLLDETISDMDRERFDMTLTGCGLIILVLLLVFAQYYRMARQQFKLLEAARAEAERAAAAKSDFLSNMSHDIRTPMNAIVGMTAIAMANEDNPAQVHSCLKKITISSKHLLGLINDVLDMSKIESGKLTLNMERMSLREAMESIVSIIQPQVKEKGQSFNISIHDIEAESVYCDVVRLNQVLINFLSNAVKFTPEGGAIQVILTEEPSPSGEKFVRIHLWVKDNGIGMSKEFQKKIFDSFEREDRQRVQKTEGTGLGMAITKYIVDAMGGMIEVESEPGKGSQFHVILDLERADEMEEMRLPAWDVLVVDDDEQLCGSIVSSLSDMGVHAEWALDGRTAVQMARERHERGQDYFLILLDCRMPEMDGIETTRRLRECLGSGLSIVLISAYDWSEIEEEARRAGANGFLAKPLFKSTLYHGLKGYAQDGAKEGGKAERISDFGGLRLLVAEDNDLNWEIAEELLSVLNLKLEHAENGQECVDMFGRSEERYYSAILMDIRMPVMNGYDAARTIRGMERPDADIPIIAMTADAFAEDIKRCLDCGMNAHIPKPIDVREVARVLEKYLGR